MLNSPVNPSTSDYRGGQNLTTLKQPNDVITNNIQPTQTNQQQPSRSYVNVTKTVPIQSFPTKEQAIIVNVVENVKLSDYVVSIGSLIGPKNLLFASRISNNRICMYLHSKDTVDRLIQTHKSVLVEGHEVNIRRLITPAKRLILSNVCPTIPHEIIKCELEKAGLKLVSPVSFLRAGIPLDQYSHVLSFRRQVYISPTEDQNCNLPNTLLIPFEETTYRIFISTDELSCFLCKQSGHIAKNCPTAKDQEELPLQSQMPPDRQPTNNKSVIENVHPTEITPQILPNYSTEKIAQKRPAPSINSSNNDFDEPVIQESLNKDSFNVPNTVHAPTKQNSTKKLKHSDSIEQVNYEVALEAVEKEMDNNSSKYPLSFLNLRSFLENTHGNPNPLAEAKRYTPNPEDLPRCLKNIYPLVASRTLKGRITRLTKKLITQLNAENPETRHETIIFSSQESLIDLDYSQNLNLDHIEDSS